MTAGEGDRALFEEYFSGAVSRGNKERAEAARAVLRAFGGSLTGAEALSAEISAAVGAWRRMQTSFVDIVKWGTPEIARRALAAGTPDPNAPAQHKTEHKEYPITTAVANGDEAMVRVLLESGKVDLCVCDFQTNGGCGILTVEYFSPLALALRNREKSIALAIVAAHPDLKRDAAFGVKSSFEGDSHTPLLDLATAWGDREVLAAIKEKLN